MHCVIIYKYAIAHSHTYYQGIRAYKYLYIQYNGILIISLNHNMNVHPQVYVLVIR